VQISIPIQTAPLEKITIEEVRDKLLEIQDSFFGDLIVQDSLNELNRIIEEKINKPFDLKIKAELINNNVKLFGYDLDSKAVLDPNCKIKFISKTRFKGK
jgi:hypothetical protein